MTGTRPVTRRSVLTLLGTGAAAVLGGAAATSGAAGPGGAGNEGLVWRLDAHWGYPVGPSNKTHCDCNACRAHCANKVYASEGAALAGRPHIGCVCQLRAVPIDPARRSTLFAGGATVVDLRHGGVSGAYAAAVLHS